MRCGHRSIEAFDPAAHGRALVDGDRGGDVLKLDQVERGFADDPVNVVGGQQPFMADEIRHAARPRARGFAPETFNRVKARRGACFNKDDQAKAPYRQIADL